jgi:hypothetical protein
MSARPTPTFVGRLKDVPPGEHWAILTESSADDGYGGSYTMVRYAECYGSAADWHAALSERAARQTSFSPDFVGLHIAAVARPTVQVVCQTSKVG